MSPNTNIEDEELVMNLFRDNLADIPATEYAISRPQLFSFSTPLEIEIAGTELIEIKKVADQLVTYMNESRIFRDIESSMRSGYPEIQICLLYTSPSPRDS